MNIGSHLHFIVLFSRLFVTFALKSTFYGISVIYDWLTWLTEWNISIRSDISAKDRNKSKAIQTVNSFERSRNLQCPKLNSQMHWNWCGFLFSRCRWIVFCFNYLALSRQQCNFQMAFEFEQTCQSNKTINHRTLAR